MTRTGAIHQSRLGRTAPLARLALRIATDSPYRDELRAKLESSKHLAPLFDSQAFTRDLEKMYTDLIDGSLRR